MRSICVFCGSASGAKPAYGQAARRLGRELAARGIGIVYGGGKVGLMGELAAAALEAGGRVTGVMPRHLVEKEIAHGGLSELRVVADIHERKRVMGELAEAFLALPGGFGTLEESFEVLSWADIGLHGKPFGFVDVEGYYQPLLAFLDRACAEGFLRRESRELILACPTPEQTLEAILARRPSTLSKW